MIPTLKTAAVDPACERGARLTAVAALILVTALSLAAVPAAAQQHGGHGRGHGDWNRGGPPRGNYAPRGYYGGTYAPRGSNTGAAIVGGALLGLGLGALLSNGLMAQQPYYAASPPVYYAPAPPGYYGTPPPAYYGY
jgi:uncharacterized membrane protein